MKKTVLLDFSNVAHASYYVTLGKSDLKTPDDIFDFWRFLMLSMIKKIKLKLNPDEYIICIDSMSWRKKAFKYYKANRDKKKMDADFNYKYFIEKMKLFLDELDENFPYKQIRLDGAEADDIIAILATELGKAREKIIIASNDKDLKQLVRNNVVLYNIKNGEFVDVEDARQELIFLILNGDTGDGVPNVRSDDDVFIDSNKRQKPCGAKQISKILEEGVQNYVKREGLENNFKRNRLLIDLSQNYIPINIWEGVMQAYKSLPSKQNDIRKIMMYLGEHELRSLTDEIKNFLM